ncbi:MAG: DNA repair protein RecN [Dichotomicrobium sp.]
MLTALSIENIVLIDRLHLEFGAGLSVLTGETGAGKSILLDAFGLALGGRGEASLVRADASRGQVTARFELPGDHEAVRRLAESGFDIAQEPGATELILRRVQQSDGRSRAFINDQPVSVQLLRQTGARLVEIHGQHDDRAMTDAATHRRLLDCYGGLTAEVEAVRRAWDAWRTLEGQLAEREANLAQARENADYLRHTLDELEELAPEDGEEQRLAETRQTMMNAEKIATELNGALESLSGAGGAEERLSSTLRRLERFGGGELLSPVVEVLERVLVEAGEARDTIETALRDSAYSQADLERVEERLFALRTLARKHRVTVDELPGLQAEFTRLLDELAQGEDALVRLREEMTAARKHYRAVADALSDKRRETATQLDAAVMRELPPLKLEKARFITRLDPLEEGGPDGLERVSFQVQTNPGTAPGPIMKVASGGELSRFILALKVVLAERGSAPTLIFDEIDTGVGGATAAAIGERLARLAEGAQVLAVTHAPQVAAHAQAHMRISKEAAQGERGESMVTRVAPLDHADRHEEIARMLAGAKVTEEARAAAKRLIGSAA